MTFEELGIKGTHGKQGTIYVLCPKCSSDRKPENRKKLCLTVNIEFENNWWKCHNCYWSGNFESYGKFDKIRQQANILDKVLGYDERFVKYWKDRGISESTLRKCSVYTRRESFAGISSAVATCFPYFKSMGIVNVKFRTIYEETKHFKMLKADDGAELTFWGWESFDKEGKYAIISEGEPDRMTWIECGYENVLSVPLGAPSPKAKHFDKEFQYLNQHSVKMFKDIPVIYIAVDNDAPGLLLQKHLASRLGKERCKIISYDKAKDINQVLCESKKEEVDKCFKLAKPVPVEGIIRVFDISDAEYNAFYDVGFKRGLITGEFRDFDKMYSVKRKLLTVITGTSQTGKTEWILTYLMHLCNYNPKEFLKMAMFSPESRPIIRLISRIIQIYAGKPMYHNAYNRLTKDEFHEAKKWVAEHFTFIAPIEIKEGKSNKTLAGILNYARILVQQEGIFGFVIDPWNKIDHDRPAKYSEKEYISKCLDDIMYFADINDVHVWIIAHPTKIATDQRSGNRRKVYLEDISGAAEWETKSDQGIVLHRPFFEKVRSSTGEGWDWVYNERLPTEVKVQKIKFQEVGKLGGVEMFFDLYGGGRFVDDENKLTAEPSNQLALNSVKPEAPNDDIPW